MKKIVFSLVIFIILSFNCFAANQLIKDNTGIDNIVVGKALNTDVITKYGNNYDLINHKNYSVEMKYKNLGISFYYFHNHEEKIIFNISFYQPFKGITTKGIILGESTVNDVIKKYGKDGEWNTVDNGDTWWLEYKNTEFHVKIDTSITKYPLQVEHYLNHKIIEIDVSWNNPDECP